MARSFLTLMVVCAGRSRKEAMQLTLPESDFHTSSSLALMWAKFAPESASSTASAQGVTLVAGSVLTLLTLLMAMLRVARRRTQDR